MRNLTSINLLLLACTLAGCAWLERNAQQQAVDAQRYLQQARQARRAGEFDRAQELLSKAIAANPKDADARHEFAELLREQGDSTEALEHLAFAARLEPDDSTTWVRLARARMERGEYDQMEEPLENALTIEPTNVEALWLGAQLEYHRSRQQSALGFCHRILLTDPDHVAAQTMLAELYIEQGRPDQAAPLLRSIVGQPAPEPQELANAQWGLGIAYGMQSRWGDAAGQLEQALARGIEMSPDNLYRVAFAYHRAAETPQAVRFAREVLRRRPDDPDAQLLAGTRPLPPENRTPLATASAANGIQVAGLNNASSLNTGTPTLRVPRYWK